MPSTAVPPSLASSSLQDRFAALLQCRNELLGYLESAGRRDQGAPRPRQARGCDAAVLLRTMECRLLVRPHPLREAACPPAGLGTVRSMFLNRVLSVATGRRKLLPSGVRPYSHLYPATYVFPPKSRRGLRPLHPPRYICRSDTRPVGELRCPHTPLIHSYGMSRGYLSVTTPKKEGTAMRSPPERRLTYGSALTD